MIQIKSCIVCDSSDFSFLYKSYDRMLHLPGTFSVKQCNSCSLVFLDPQPSYDALKKYYPSKNYYAYNESEKKGLFQILREYLVNHYYSPNFFSSFIATFIQNVPAMPSIYKKQGKILDVGCGAGDTLVLLQDLGWETYGIDMDKHAIETAKSRGLKNITLGTYSAISKYPNGYFDVIRLYHVIEHIDNPRLCLQLIRKKLKKGGELILGTPNVDSILSIAFRTYWYNLDSPRHLFLFSPKTLARLTKKEGFKVKKTEFCSAGGLAGSIQYLLDTKLKIKLDLIHKLYVVLLFYPLEWIFDKTKKGDVFVLRAQI